MEQNQNLSQWDTISIDKDVVETTSNETPKTKTSFLLIAIVGLFIITLGGTIILYVIFFLGKAKEETNDENTNKDNTQNVITKTIDINDQTEEIELYNTLMTAISTNDKEKLLDTVFDSNNEIQKSFALDETMTWELLESFTTDLETLSSENIEQFWKDEKQTIITIKNTNSNGTIFYIRDKESNAKILKVGSIYSEDIPIDTDQDGRYDEDEDCTSTYYNIFEEDCIKTDINKRDTDGDGYWDGIEIEAETDPNDSDSKPI